MYRNSGGLSIRLQRTEEEGESLSPLGRSRHYRPPRRGGEARPARAHRLPWLAALERGAHLFPDHGTRSLHRRIHLAVRLRHLPARGTTDHRGPAGGISGLTGWGGGGSERELRN
jgi:hypothetical protein